MPELIGRSGVLGELAELLQGAQESRPAVVLIAGEMGVGKTRLIQELITRQKPVALAGACVPMDGDPLPFAPFRQGLRRLSRHPVVRQELSRAPALARLGSAGLTDDANPEPQIPAVLFQSVLTLLSRLGAGGAVLHVAEDLHWADPATLDLLRYLAVNLSTERVLVVGTYRDDAVTTGSELAGWLAEVARLDLTHRIRLDRLDEQDSARLVTAFSGGTAEPSLLDNAIARSAGNPLFIEHIVLADSATSQALPTTLHELLAARVAQLPASTRSLLPALTVHGRPVTVGLLAATVHQDIPRVEDALRPGLIQHVLESQDEQIAFRHPGFAEVLGAGLLPSERVRLHLAAAEALTGEPVPAGGSADRVAVELARHWLRAGDERALPAAVAAGHAASRMNAFAESLRWFTHAAQMVLGAGDPIGAPAPIELFSRAAEAAALTGDTAEAIRLGERALTFAEQPTQRADLCERLGSYAFLGGHGAASAKWFEQARDLLADDDVTELAARVDAGLALYQATWSLLDDAEATGHRGLSVARACGARRAEGQLHNALGLAAIARGQVDQGVDHLHDALAIAIELDDPRSLGAAYVNLGHVLGMAARHDEAVRIGYAGMTVLARLGLGTLYGNVVRANTCEALVTLGRLDEAQALLDDPYTRRVGGIMAAPGLVQRARIAVLRGDLTLAWDECSRARAIIESEGAPDAWVREMYALNALIELWAGRPEAAYEAVLDGLHLTTGDEERFGDQLAVLGMRALADRVEAHRDHATRRAVSGQVEPLSAALARSGGRLEHAAYAASFAAEHARLQRRGAPELWVRAAHEWDLAGQPLQALYARWREAEARLDAGVDAAAIGALRQAHLRAEQLGASRIGEELTRLAGWHHVELAAAPAEAADHPQESQESQESPGIERYGLTDRELEVLAALADGRTNREIGLALNISIKTASVHVSNILRKLDVSSRQEAARVAHRVGHPVPPVRS